MTRRVDAADVVELRLIGEWLNSRFPTNEDSDGDRILAAADEIERLRAELVCAKVQQLSMNIVQRYES